MSAINFVALDAARAGVEKHLQQGLADAVVVMNEQEVGDRQEGACTISIKVKLVPKKDAVIIETSSSFKAPARAATDGVVAHVRSGRLIVADAEQLDLPVSNVRNLGATPKEI